MAPLQAELSPPRRRRGVRPLQRSREGGSWQENGGGNEKGNDSPPQYEREALPGLPSKMKGVVQPAPDLQTFVDRSRRKVYLIFWPSLLPEAGPSAFPLLHAAEKTSSPRGIGGRLIRPELSRFHRLIKSLSGSRGRLTLGWRAPACHIK
jgi:hypothetical protein